MSVSKDNSINNSIHSFEISKMTLCILDYLECKTSVFYLTIGAFIITSLLLFPVYLTGNEENLFMVSHKRVQPELFPNLHSIFELSNARIFPELIFGYLIKWSGYEVTHVISRLTMIGLYSISLAILFNALKISILSSVIILSVFHLTGEFIVGQDWLFKGVETKTIAYAAIISALGLAIKKKWTVAIILTIIATYFHFLVGGFWLLAILLLVFLKTSDTSRIAKLFILYLCSVLPLIAIIYFDQFNSTSSQVLINAEYIYAERSAHHALPFFNTFKFYQEWLPGFALAVILFFTLLSIRPTYSDKSLIDFLLILLLYLFFALFLSYLDKETHLLAKFFMFRPSSIIWLLTITIIFSFLRENMNTQARNAWLVLMLVSLPLILTPIIRKKIREFISQSQNSLVIEVTKVIEQNSKPNEVILLDPSTPAELAAISFQRKIPRPFLVKRKFAPTHPKSIIQWKKRIDFRKTIFTKGCTKKMEYPVRLLFAANTKMDSIINCGKIIWKSDHYHIVEIDQKFRKK